MQKTDKKLGKFILLVALVPILLLLLSFGSVIFNLDFIESNMDSAGVSEYKEINSYVIQYLATPNGDRLISLNFFDVKEQSHLLDVKILVHLVFDILFLLLVLFFALMYYNKLWKCDLSKVFIYGGLITAVIPLILYFVPFDALFVFFHNIFFAKETWMFGPGSNLIRVYPSNFWYFVSFGLFLRAFFAGILIAIVGFFKKYS